MWPEREVEEARGHLVVLLVREVRQRREFSGIHGGDEGLGGRRRALAVAGRDLAQALLAEPTDGGAHEGVGDAAPFHPVDGLASGLTHAGCSSVARGQNGPSRRGVRADGGPRTGIFRPLDGQKVFKSYTESPRKSM